jgi:amino acid permease
MFSSKVKVFAIYASCFIVVFLITRVIAVQFFTEPTFWTTFIPIACAMILAPKPHIVQDGEDKRYGLKSVFFKHIYWIDK